MVDLSMPIEQDIFKAEPVGEGGESIVYLTQLEDYVVKIPNTKPLRKGGENVRPQELLAK